MFVVKPAIVLNDNKDQYKKKKYIQKYDKINPVYKTAHNYDLRLIIVRHAERVDQTLGKNWYDKVFGGVPSAPTRSYRHPSLPIKLPVRSNTLLYVFDPPITRVGEQQSFQKGQQLNRVGANIDYCYSSPASRSIITANAILKGMNRSHIPIRPEPYLFEPMNWNTPLRMLGNISPFMSAGDWIQTGYNVDRRYQRLNDYLNAYETENDYYNRSQTFFQSIERRHGGLSPAVAHGYAPRRRTTVLIVGHASSSEIFSTIALRQPFDAKIFGEQCAKVPYLHSVVLERDAISHIWYIRPVMYFL
jgi:broad specificity phosphatase PhoE